MKAKAKYGQALRLASTTQLTREQWLAIRKLGIGSSDAAVAVGITSASTESALAAGLVMGVMAGLPMVLKGHLPDGFEATF